MIDVDPASLVIGLVFGAIGFVAFRYGRKMELLSPVVIGLALMFYSSFVRDQFWLLVVGTALTGALWVFRE
jgi:cbb3-type cytochrome oxidase subunit 1